MLTYSLQSGSNGNSIYVEAGDVRLLFDAGISGSCAERRTAVHHRNIRDVDAVIISHDHNDHIRNAGIFQRKFGLPLYMTPHTQEATWCKLGQLHDVRHFSSGDTITFGSVLVHTTRTAHDAADGVVFVIEHEGKRLGIFTDLGHCYDGLSALIESVDAAYLECNYDTAMLESGDYPPHLKARIRGDGGHLSNDDAHELLRACGTRRPKWIAVAHLSESNNHPDLAMNAVRTAVGADYPVHHAPRYETSKLLTVP